MLGWKLFLRALTLLIENLGDALRVSALPYAAVIAVSVWVSGAFPSTLEPQTITPGTEISGAAAGATLLMMVVNLIVSLWIAVAWHRYVLLEERPAGWVPPLNGAAMLVYLGRLLLIGLLVGIAIVGVSIPLGFLTLAIPGGTLLVGAVAMFVGMIVFYRLAIVLPAGAVDRSMTFGEALEVTKGQSQTVVVLALLTVGFSLLLQVPTMIEGSVGVITAIYQGVVGWIGLMLGVSTLTALYGHLVEGRPVE